MRRSPPTHLPRPRSHTPPPASRHPPPAVRCFSAAQRPRRNIDPVSDPARSPLRIRGTLRWGLSRTRRPHSDRNPLGLTPDLDQHRVAAGAVSPVPAGVPDPPRGRRRRAVGRWHDSSGWRAGRTPADPQMLFHVGRHGQPPGHASSEAQTVLGEVGFEWRRRVGLSCCLQRRLSRRRKRHGVTHDEVTGAGRLVADPLTTQGENRGRHSWLRRRPLGRGGLGTSGRLRSHGRHRASREGEHHPAGRCG